MVEILRTVEGNDGKLSKRSLCVVSAQVPMHKAEAV